MRKPALTVAICTMDRPGPLVEVLGALAAQDLDGGWDVLVLDEGTTPLREADLSGTLQGRAPLRLVRKDAGDTPGLYGSRRACAAAAGGELVLFLDDDAVPAPDYLSRLAALAAAWPGHAGFGGVDRLGLPERAGRVARLYARAFLVAGPGPGRLGATGYNHAQMTWRMQAGPFESEFLHGCNMAFRKQALEGLPHLAWLTGHSCCEDLVLSAHASRSGALLVDPSLRVEHRLAPGGRGTNAERLGATIVNHARFLAWHRRRPSRAAFAWGMAGLLAKDLTRGLAKRGLPMAGVLSAYARGVPPALTILGEGRR